MALEALSQRTAAKRKKRKLKSRRINKKTNRKTQKPSPKMYKKWKTLRKRRAKIRK